MTTRSWSRFLPSGFALLALISLLLVLPTQALASISIISPKSQAVISGKILVTATAGDTKFAYAVVFIDGVGVSATNSLPLRFELDTTHLADGPHRLQLGLFDDSGIFAVSAPTAVIASNTVVRPAIAAQQQPAPKVAPSTPAAAAPKPAPVAAAPKATPTAQAAPKIALSFPARGTQQATVTKPTTPSDKFTIMLDGKPVEFTPGAYLEQGRLMVMLRPLVEAGKGMITWDGEKATATINAQTITVTPNQTLATVNGREVTLDQPAVNKDGRIWLPATAWRTFFGAEVSYTPEYRTVWLRSREAAVRDDANAE